MKVSSVGMKCSECAAPPASARRPNTLGYVRAGIYSLVVATVLGAVLTILIGGLGGFFLPLLVGLATGVVAAGGFKRGRDRGLAILAASCTFVGLAAGPMLLGVPIAALLNGRFLIGALIAAFVAAFRLWE